MQSRLLISRSAVEHNLRLIRSHLPPGVKLCAMVKAGAYGHGLREFVGLLNEIRPAVDQLGVASLDEAVVVADAGVTVLVLRAVEELGPAGQRELVGQAVRQGCQLTLASAAGADDLAGIANGIGKRANVHLMIDTGLSRCGVNVAALPGLVERIQSHASLRLASLSTHLAIGDVPDDPYTVEQLAKFRTATDGIAAKYGSELTRHVAASDGIFAHPETHLDMVRAGISLYGMESTTHPTPGRPLRPVARWVAPILSILDVRRGATVGYSRTWTAPRDTRVGLLPVGYADGYSRGRGGRGAVLVKGVAVPVVGRVSMDQMTIDLGDVSAAVVGDEVTLMSDDPGSPASAYALARLDDTIPDEVFTRIGPRVRRVVVD